MRIVFSSFLKHIYMDAWPGTALREGTVESPSLFCARGRSRTLKLGTGGIL